MILNFQVQLPSFGMLVRCLRGDFQASEVIHHASEMIFEASRVIVCATKVDIVIHEMYEF